MKLTFIEMFCGIGGFRLGLERNGWKCVWSNDVDKYACQVYRKNFGYRELVECDIRSVDVDSVPEHMLLTAGFPCQSFSFAGKRKGFEDTRGALFYDIARVAAAKRPSLLLLENVKGLLSNDKGRTFARILQTLDELGYDVEWQTLNSKYFGVPQNRERVFIIGHLRGTGSRQIFPIGEASANVKRTHEKTQRERARFRVMHSLNTGENGGERNMTVSALIHSYGLETHDGDVSHSFKETEDGSSRNVIIANTLSSRYFKDGSENLIQVCDGCSKSTEEMETLAEKENRQGTNHAIILKRHRADEIRNHGQICPTLTRTDYKHYWLMMTAHTKAAMKQRLQNRESTWTLDGTKGKMAIVQLNGNVRRLTPVECERLQGFPDDWTKLGLACDGRIVNISDMQRYKLLGNAVTVSVIEFLGGLLRRCLQ